ncbi:MAG: hypothetical protein M0Z88_08370 [Actinomycetota bacterium]|nr:hypothetical protein [Actinomycetota bacterium]
MARRTVVSISDGKGGGCGVPGAVGGKSEVLVAAAVIAGWPPPAGGTSTHRGTSGLVVVGALPWGGIPLPGSVRAANAGVAVGGRGSFRGAGPVAGAAGRAVSAAGGGAGVERALSDRRPTSPPSAADPPSIREFLKAPRDGGLAGFPRGSGAWAVAVVAAMAARRPAKVSLLEP